MRFGHLWKSIKFILNVNILVVHQSVIIPKSRTGFSRKINMCFIHMSSGVTFVFWTELECGRVKVYSTAPDKVMDEALVSIHSASNLYRYIKDILWYWTVKALYFHFEWASVAGKYMLAFISLSATTRTVCQSWRDSLQRMIASNAR